LEGGDTDDANGLDYDKKGKNIRLSHMEISHCRCISSGHSLQFSAKGFVNVLLAYRWYLDLLPRVGGAFRTFAVPIGWKRLILNLIGDPRLHRTFRLAMEIIWTMQI